MERRDNPTPGGCGVLDEIPQSTDKCRVMWLCGRTLIFCQTDRFMRERRDVATQFTPQHTRMRSLAAQATVFLNKAMWHAFMRHLPSPTTSTSGSNKPKQLYGKTFIYCPVIDFAVPWVTIVTLFTGGTYDLYDLHDL